MIKTSYKTLKIWEKGMNLVKKIYQLTEQFPSKEIYGLTSQMRRSSVSIPSNIAEGSQRVSDKEFANFILISKGSLAELETQTIIANELSYITKEDADLLIGEMSDLQKMLFSFHNRLKAKS